MKEPYAPVAGPMPACVAAHGLEPCRPGHPRGLFCGRCGKLLDPDGLRTIRIDGFTGPASLVPSVEHFWSTGDPSRLDPTKR